MRTAFSIWLDAVDNTIEIRESRSTLAMVRDDLPVEFWRSCYDAGMSTGEAVSLARIAYRRSTLVTA